MRLGALWGFLLLMGPGIITSNVDNDAGGITTYSLAGAQFGLSLLWSFIPITFVLIIVQEMGARMGVVSGKGLSDLIRERFGVKITFYMMILLVVTNLGNTFAEFAGIAASLQIFGLSRYITIPLSILFLMWLAVKGTYRSVEKVFLAACVFYLAYVVTGFLVRPDWTEVIHAVAAPTIKTDPAFLIMLVGLVGTTIAPWMQFYLQASVVDKGLSVKDLKAVRIDVVVGSVLVSIVAFFIVLACSATLFKAGIKVETAEEAALALRPLAGEYCAWLFAFGLFNASMFAAAILPLSTAYTVCEAFGWESSLDKKFSEAPQFYGLYCFTIFFSGLLILIPNLPLISIMFISQVINGLVLPIVLIFMILLINDPEVMRDRTNGPIMNIISWVSVALLIALSAVTVLSGFLGLFTG
ncbi:MAG: Nramp family divalent metal transporter [Desulfomonile tiedjei]|uniref:Nramp family divalent metal transporter n=1 Tax=Desulfomonile tiedjei TaxID=2358 RepID=A0A9D6UZW2_9BACT|nr:Nramp family divalent metal transporter [Desulfomonile tiedjei]